ncbi:hypothetical protein SBDP1_500037 [Syntrophobacter sp. SbD1]|nr:hypothetical protein SBDP1_500037 [Syntrophobacter sp. SbD1]
MLHIDYAKQGLYLGKIQPWSNEKNTCFGSRNATCLPCPLLAENVPAWENF